jgi:hypothetical protein
MGASFLGIENQSGGKEKAPAALWPLIEKEAVSMV